MAGQFLYGIDFCFNPVSPGTADGEGHYPLAYGFIQRRDEQSPWTKVPGFSEPVSKNDLFGFQFYDLSLTLSQIDFATVAFRPDPDAGVGSGGAASNPSPFSDNDFETLDKGKTVALTMRNETSCGCAANGNGFYLGRFSIKNSGDYEMTIEIQVTSGGQKLQFKCDPRVQVGP
jgi:hypothetical protein